MVIFQFAMLVIIWGSNTIQNPMNPSFSYGFPMVFHNFLLVRSTINHYKIPLKYHFSMIFLWFSPLNPIKVPFSHGFPMIFPWFSGSCHVFLRRSPRSLYRGLIFGDGAGLDNMGFAIEGSWRGESSSAEAGPEAIYK